MRKNAGGVLCDMALVLCIVLIAFVAGYGYGKNAEPEEHICTVELSKLLPPGYKLAVNQQYVKVYYAITNEPYRAWTIYYSDGETYDAQGNWVSLYREPTIAYVDMREK